MPITCLEMSSRAIGNQLFEFATLFGVGKKLDLDIRIPTGKNHIHGPSGQNIIQLKEIFNIIAPDITDEEINSIKYTYVEKRKEFNPEIFNEVKDCTNIIGFFQSPQYFNHCWYELSKQLTFKNKWINEAIVKFSKLGVNPKESIGIHRRLGDFLKNPGVNQFHPVLDLGYYEASCRYIKTNFPITNNYSYLIFSDDIDICKKEFGRHCLFIDNREYGEYNNVMDFVMLSMCSGAKCLANSSFSYWTAKLGGKCPITYPNIYTNYGMSFHPMKEEKEWIKI